MPQPELFILESLETDEEDECLEGFALQDILKLTGKTQTIYKYIRTKSELQHFVNVFTESNYRYLHISMHGHKEGIGTSLNWISNSELADILRPALKQKRVFFSSCNVPSKNLARMLFKERLLYSLIGPTKSIKFANSASFWCAFYTLIFEVNDDSMKHADIYKILKLLQPIAGVPLAYYRHDENEDGFKRYLIGKLKEASTSR